MYMYPVLDATYHPAELLSEVRDNSVPKGDVVDVKTTAVERRTQARHKSSAR